LKGKKKTVRLNMPKATLKIEVSTRERLKKLGCMDDTFDSVINMLLDHYEKTQKK
jgi:hypothetical protein